MAEAQTTSHATGRAPDGPWSGVLFECCRMLGSRVASVVAEQHSELIRDLEAQLRGTYDADLGNTLGEALRMLRGQTVGLSGAFAAAFDRVSKDRVRSGVRGSTRSYRVDRGASVELSLIDDAVFSETLTIRAHGASLASSCEAELRELLPRVALMLGGDEPDESRNPLGPEALAEALKHACWDFDCSLKAREIVLAQCVRRVAAELAPVYRDLNARLVERRVLPRVRPVVKRGGGRPAPRREFKLPAAAASDTVRRLLAPVQRADGVGAPGGTASAAGTGSGGVPPVVLDALTRLQRGAGEVELGGQHFRLDAAAAETMNVLRVLLDAGIGRQVGAVDGIVIDVVATLFDFIFDDDRVPVVMKGLIGRLQLPVLKLALVDHEFFANRRHPARRLINTMAQAASTWDGEFTSTCSLYLAAEPAIQQIQSGGEDSAVFAQALAALEKFLAEQERAADDKAASFTERLTAREEAEIARSIAAGAVAVHTTDESLPATIRDVLRTRWSLVLAEAARKGGESGSAWGEAVATMDDLVWSVRPKLRAEERQRLVRLLPGLLARMQSGLEASGMPEDARRAFFSELVTLHAQAVKNGMQTAGTAPPAMVSAPQPEAFVPHDGLDELRRGDWVELLMDADVAERRAVRLTWISPARTMFLFANRQGVRAVALTRTELARKFDAGEALLMDDEPLMDRLVANVLHEYQPHSELGQT